MPVSPASAAADRLARLPSGRHYGASADSQCWVMVGRDLHDVTTWSIVPPAASLTLAWGEGGCAIEFAGGGLRMRRGDVMWIDAEFVHRGENVAGSDFLTVFIPHRYVSAAALDTAPIGAAAGRAPVELADMLTCLAVLLLDGASTRAEEGPFLDAILDWVGTCFAPRNEHSAHHAPAARAAARLREHEAGRLVIADIAQDVGLSPPELSRRFKALYRVTPEEYRKQVRLAVATRALAAGATVLDAAHGAGFSDTAHLSRTFRAQYGITPSRWARRIGPARKCVQAAAPSG